MQLQSRYVYSMHQQWHTTMISLLTTHHKCAICFVLMLDLALLKSFDLGQQPFTQILA